MRLLIILVFLAGLILGGLPNHLATPQGSFDETTPFEAAPPDVEELLLDFVDDFQTDGHARPMTFGIEVRDANPSRWTVFVEEPEEGLHPTSMIQGFPLDPIPYYTTDVDTLTRIHRGDLAALTAMGKTFSTDFSPLDLKETPGYSPPEEVRDYLIIHGFHFWTRGFPELIRFGAPERSRSSHGGEATLLYYRKGFRSGFFTIRPGQHINKDPLTQTNPFPSLIIVNAGRAEARIGDTHCEIQEGEAIYIGPNVRHEFWIDAEETQNAQGFLFMFGEGA